MAARPGPPQLELELRKAATTIQRQKGLGDKTDSSAKSDKPKDDKKPPADKRAEEDRAMLKWFDEKASEGFGAMEASATPGFPQPESRGWRMGSLRANEPSAKVAR